MAGNRTITKITALLLMLIFSQKMGMSLYLHNWLHAAKLHSTASKSTSQEIKFACGCINDFTLPFTETATYEVQVPPSIKQQPLSPPVVSYPTVYKYFHSLRAPPASA